MQHAVAASQGIVECSECDTVFDALVALQSDDDTPHEANASSTVQLGDRALIQIAGLRPAKPWIPRDDIAVAQQAASVDETSIAANRATNTRAARAGINYLRLALRNLVRYRRRSAMALAAIVFGVIAILLAGGFIEWILQAMRESAIRSQYGHVQVVRSGYLEGGAAEPLNYLLPAEAELVDGIERDSDVAVLAPRLHFSGLASRDDTTISFVGEGVDPNKEAVLSESVHIRSGVDLDAAKPNQAIVGAGLAESLGVAVGENIVLLTTSSSGGMNAVEVEVAGIFTTAVKAFDDTALRVPIATARELLRVDGSHAWLVLLHETSATDAVKSRVEAIVSENAADYDVVPWYELADFYNKTERLFSRQINLVWIVIGLLILLSISNTMMMSVLERTREIGTLMAVGLSRKTVMKLFLQEGVVLGAVGGVIGLCLGIVLAYVISAIGIPMPPPPGMDVGYSGEILVTGGLIAAGTFVAVFVTTIAAAYPAWKASQLDIVDALRHNQ